MAADLAIKEPCRVATTANITLSGLQTIDGVSVSAGDRVLVRAQGTASQNGIYVAASGAWSRATDFDGAGEVAGGTQAFVTSGTLFADSVWRVAGNGAVTIGSAIDFDPEFIQTGTGAVPRTLLGKARECVSVLDYGAVGDGTTDDSAAIQAAIDANKGKLIVLPSGYTFLADGIALSGSTYNGTGIIIEGVFLLAPSGGTFNWDPFVAASYNGIILHDVEDIFIDVPGMMDGNRANQPNSNPPYDNQIQQHHLIHLFGARRVRIAQFNGREVRGDGIVVNSKTAISPLTVNSRDIIIGPIRVINSADDGRNALSIISCENIVIAGGLSIKVGGRNVGGLIMPGGFDIEPDGDWHVVRNVRSGPWYVETEGLTGIAVLGKPFTDDAAQDWNLEDVSIADSTVVITSDDEGGPQFRRVRRLTADVTLVRSGDRERGIFVDFCNFCRFRLRVSGVTHGVTVGEEGWFRDSDMRVEIEDHDGVGLRVQGAERARFSGYVRGGVSNAGTYGVQAAASAVHSSLTQTDVTYSVDVPYDSSNAFGFHTGPNITYVDCAIADCAFNGYSGYGSQMGFYTFLPSRNVQGRNFGTAMPGTGYWKQGDFVQNVTPSVSGNRVILGWSRLTTQSTNVAGTDWVPAYAATV